MTKSKTKPGPRSRTTTTKARAPSTTQSTRAPLGKRRTPLSQDVDDALPERPRRATFGTDNPWQKTRWRYLDEQDAYLTSGIEHFAIRFKDVRGESFSLPIPRHITSRAMAEAVASELMHTALALSSWMTEDPMLRVTVEEREGEWQDDERG